MRILLVEDEPDAARMLAKGLREQAYAVDIAADGETAEIHGATERPLRAILQEVLGKTPFTYIF